MDLPNALRRFRKKYNLTQKQVSSRIGINIRLYQKYEAGEVDPGASVITAVAEAFNVSADYLLGLGETQDTNESFLLNIYRNLDEGSRRTLTDMANFLNMKQGFEQAAAV